MRDWLAQFSQAAAAWSRSADPASYANRRKSISLAESQPK